MMKQAATYKKPPGQVSKELVTLRLRENSLWIVPLVVTAALNTLWIVYSELNSNPDTIFRSGEYTIIVEPATGFIQMKLRIGLALVLGAAALLTRRLMGVIISCLALGWLIIEYFFWWRTSFAIVRNAEALDFSKIQHTLYLYEAGWWDLLVFGAAVVILMWELKILMSSYLSSRSISLSKPSN